MVVPVVSHKRAGVHMDYCLVSVVASKHPCLKGPATWQEPTGIFPHVQSEHIDILWGGMKQIFNNLKQKYLARDLLPGWFWHNREVDLNKKRNCI